MSVHQQINFAGKLEEDDCDNVFYSSKAAKNYSKLFFRLIICKRII